MPLPVKNWFSPNDAQQKLLAASLAYGLSKKLNRRSYETVNESHIDILALDSDIPDVIVYDLKNNFKPLLIVEFCIEEDLQSTLRTVEIIAAAYGIQESFVLNTTTGVWHRISSNTTSFSSRSNFFNLNLQDLLFHSLQNHF